MHVFGELFSCISFGILFKVLGYVIIQLNNILFFIIFSIVVLDNVHILIFCPSKSILSSKPQIMQEVTRVVCQSTVVCQEQ